MDIKYSMQEYAVREKVTLFEEKENGREKEEERIKTKSQKK